MRKCSGQKNKQKTKKKLPEKYQRKMFIFLWQFANVYAPAHTRIGSFSFISFTIQVICIFSLFRSSF